MTRKGGNQVETAFASFSFLTAGPTFRFDLPADFALIPTISTPIINGVGGRLVDFVPSERDSVWRGDWLGENSYLGELTGDDGRKADLYRRIESPPLWWLRWTLEAGGLYTHLREEDGEGMGQLELDSLSILETDDAAPFLILKPPLARAVSTRPGYAERATFFDSAIAPTTSVTMQRPSFVNEGVTLAMPDQQRWEPATLRVGTSLDLEIQVRAANLDAAEALIEMVMPSITDA
jgi:hypothetical protein